MIFPFELDNFSCIRRKVASGVSFEATVATLPWVPRRWSLLGDDSAFPSWLSSVRVLHLLEGSPSSLKIETYERVNLPRIWGLKWGISYQAIL
jgi:hypothetical protein